MSPPLAVRRATMAARACLVVVGGGACRVRFPCNARLGLVVEGVLVVGPFVDLVGLGRASGRYARARLAAGAAALLLSVATLTAYARLVALAPASSPSEPSS
jgi:hypothetical protein